MGKPQIITTDSGDELVVLPRRDYDALLAQLGDAAAENAATARILAETSGDIAIPESVWEAIEAGQTPIHALRKHRGLTQADLATRAGISQGYLSELENGRKTGDLATLKSLAATLGVGLDALTE